jgi:hypothetical protein
MKRRGFLQTIGALLIATQIPPLERVGRKLYDPRRARLAIRDPQTGEWIVIKGIEDPGGFDRA